MSTFDPQSIAKSVHNTLEDAYAAIPPGKRRALIIDASAQQREMRALYVERLSHGWSVALEGRVSHGHKPDGKVALLWSK
jgi:hypothetical protein